MKNLCITFRFWSSFSSIGVAMVSESFIIPEIIQRRGILSVIYDLKWETCLK